jgi:hypothetical protein
VLGVAGLVYGSVENRRRVRLEAEYDYDADLRRLRLERTRNLTMPQPVAKYARPSAWLSAAADLAGLEIQRVLESRSAESRGDLVLWMSPPSRSRR